MSATLQARDAEPTVDAKTRLAFGTPIGVDVGRRHLLALAPGAASPGLAEGHLVDDDRLEDYYRTLQQRHAGQPTGTVDDILASRLSARLDRAAQEALTYAQSFETPVVVLEDLGYPERPLDECVAARAEPECWLYPTIQTRLAECARSADIPVAVTSKKYTTRQCHVCDQFASIGDSTITCSTEDCPVDVVCRDQSAAASIAKRVL